MLDSNDYELKGFRVSTNNKKKYDAILRNKTTNRIKHVSFGSRDHQQYLDRLGYYSAQNHLDKNRQRLYKLRHQNDNLNTYSPGYFAWFYLW